MEDLDPMFVSRGQKGRHNRCRRKLWLRFFREHAPIAIKESGIACVVAKSFARIFYRNAINIGLPIVECDVDVDEGDVLTVDFDTGVIVNETRRAHQQTSRHSRRF